MKTVGIFNGFSHHCSGSETGADNTPSFFLLATSVQQKLVYLLYGEGRGRALRLRMSRRLIEKTYFSSRSVISTQMFLLRHSSERLQSSGCFTQYTRANSPSTTSRICPTLIFSGFRASTKPPRLPRILRTRPAAFKGIISCSRYFLERSWRSAISFKGMGP